MLVGHVDQPLRRLFGVVDVAEDLGHLVDAHLVGQPVGAEEDPVPGAQIELPHVGLHLGGHAEGAGEDVALRVDGRLRLGHLAVAHPLLGQAVVVGDLDQLALGEDVGPRVADVGQGQHVAGRRRRPTSAIAVSVVPMPRRSALAWLSCHTAALASEKASRSPSDRGCALEGLLERLDRDPRRHLAADVTAHAVGDRVEVRPLERHVLVDGADPPDVGRRAGAQHGHRETSKTVEPIWSRSPLPRRTACVICSELT